MKIAKKSKERTVRVHIELGVPDLTLNLLALNLNRSDTCNFYYQHYQNDQWSTTGMTLETQHDTSGTSTGAKFLKDVIRLLNTLEKLSNVPAHQILRDLPFMTPASHWFDIIDRDRLAESELFGEGDNTEPVIVQYYTDLDVTDHVIRQIRRQVQFEKFLELQYLDGGRSRYTYLLRVKDTDCTEPDVRLTDGDQSTPEPSELGALRERVDLLEKQVLRLTELLKQWIQWFPEHGQSTGKGSVHVNGVASEKITTSYIPAHGNSWTR